MELIRKAIRLGNSAGVILPKKLLGSEVKISVINIPVNIKREALKLLYSYLSDIIGAYVTNKNLKPFSIMAVSTGIKENIENDKVKISIVPLSKIKKDIKTNFALRSKLEKLKADDAILNKDLLFKLQKEARNL